MRTRIVLALGAAVLALAGGVACGGGATPAPTPTPTLTPTSRPVTTPTKTPPPTVSVTPPSSIAVPTTTRPISLEQQNAVRTATDYLDGQSFSRTGLIKQLKYEGFSTKDATAAVDSLHVNWNAQAALVAKSYLDGQSFSRSGLLEQLGYEGFTKSQAAYGVKAAGL